MPLWTGGEGRGVGHGGSLPKYPRGSFLNDLKRFLVEHDQVTEALVYLRRPKTIENPCFRWLTPQATTDDLLQFADLIEAAA